MNDMTGHNLPPSDADAVRTRLADAHGDVVDRAQAILNSITRMPGSVDDEDMAGKFSDQIKVISTCMKDCEGRRTMEKAPFREAGDAVDGFFKHLSEPLKAAKKQATELLGTYQRRVADEERRRREEVARQAREEEARLRREAEEREAEARRKEQARLKAEEDARIAREKQAKAAKTSAPEMDTAPPTPSKEEEEAELAAAVAAEDAAKAAEEASLKAAAEANAKAADLARTRGQHGAVSSQRTRWVHDEASVDRAVLDLEVLRQHIPDDGLHKAIRSFVKAGGRDLPGVYIYERHDTVVR